MGQKMGQEFKKTAINITKCENRIRLRWRLNGKRYSLNHSSYSAFNLLEAKKVALQIEQDILLGCFDASLVKYGARKKEAGKATTLPETFVSQFEWWVKHYKHMDCEIHINYNAFRNMIRKWGKQVDEKNVLKKMNAETFCATTYNRRLTILKQFVLWLVKMGIWSSNPLEDVQKKKEKRVKSQKRQPFTPDEISRILKAIKYDEACSPSSSFRHSHYYPFVYFLFKTGVRNAEAIGLRVKHVHLEKGVIEISEVMARTLKSTSAVNRVRKETKNGKIRFIPLTQDLRDVLMPLLQGRNSDELVFTSPLGHAIDDKNFQNRVFKKVQQHLDIRERVLYACRHTFGSRCIEAGITPVMTAFLMGNNPETALRNYTHQLGLPDDLPKI
jgi:integrase